MSERKGQAGRAVPKGKIERYRLTAENPGFLNPEDAKAYAESAGKPVRVTQQASCCEGSVQKLSEYEEAVISRNRITCSPIGTKQSSSPPHQPVVCSKLLLAI